MQTSCFSHPRHPLPTPSPLKQAVLSCLGWMRTRFDHWRHARRAAANRRVLRSLSNEMLKDMGLDRSDIESWIACGETDRRPRG